MNEETIKKQTPAFLEKLFDILEDNISYSHLISWQPTGTSFIIKRVNEFSETVLPKYFKHSNIQSYIRQLNMYGFSKTRHDSNHREFTHRLFQRGRRDLLPYIKRKTQHNNRIDETSSIATGNQSEILNHPIHFSVDSYMILENPSNNEERIDYPNSNKSMNNSSVSCEEDLRKRISALENCLYEAVRSYKELAIKHNRLCDALQKIWSSDKSFSRKRSNDEIDDPLHTETVGNDKANGVPLCRIKSLDVTRIDITNYSEANNFMNKQEKSEVVSPITSLNDEMNLQTEQKVTEKNIYPFNIFKTDAVLDLNKYSNLLSNAHGIVKKLSQGLDSIQSFEGKDPSILDDGSLDAFDEEESENRLFKQSDVPQIDTNKRSKVNEIYLNGSQNLKAFKTSAKLDISGKPPKMLKQASTAAIPSSVVKMAIKNEFARSNSIDLGGLEAITAAADILDKHRTQHTSNGNKGITPSNPVRSGIVRFRSGWRDSSIAFPMHDTIKDSMDVVIQPTDSNGSSAASSFTHTGKVPEVDFNKQSNNSGPLHSTRNALSFNDSFLTNAKEVVELSVALEGKEIIKSHTFG